VFVSARGRASSQFKRALERRNFLLAWTMAAELPKVPLADALSLRLALDQQSWRFERAAPCCHARLCDEARLTLADAQLAVSALDALAGPGVVAGGQALGAICDADGFEDVVGGPEHLAGRAGGGVVSLAPAGAEARAAPGKTETAPRRPAHALTKRLLLDRRRG
jgi:hypothetical protein